MSGHCYTFQQYRARAEAIRNEDGAALEAARGDALYQTPAADIEREYRVMAKRRKRLMEARAKKLVHLAEPRN